MSCYSYWKYSKGSAAALITDTGHEAGGCCSGNIGYVVLDEADKMLSLGFKAQLDQIWEDIKGTQDIISSDGLPRPQVSHCQDCPASICLHE
jgi:hypothetical protein